MCQIWIKPKGIMLPRSFWDAINDYNQEGLGVYNITKDTLYKTEDYEDGWNYIQDNIDDQMIVHHRLATSGACSIDQLHGWDMGNGYVFFHNGVLRSYQGNASLSDTQQFVQEWAGTPIKPLTKFLETVETSSRFVLVNRETKEIHLPKCAKWNPVYIEELGITIQFSNEYAFSYHLLPARYGRWTATGNPRKTRTGLTSKKAFKSVFEAEKMGYITLPYQQDTPGTCGALKMHRYGDSQYQAFEPHQVRIASRQLHSFIKSSYKPEYSEVYAQSVYNIKGTNQWILGTTAHKMLTNKIKKLSKRHIIDASHAYTTNDLVACHDKHIARAYLLVTRERGMFKTYTTSVMPFIAGFERAIGERIKPMKLVDLYALAEIAHLNLCNDKQAQLNMLYVNAFTDTVAKLMDHYTGVLTEQQRQSFTTDMQKILEELQKQERLEVKRMIEAMKKQNKKNAQLKVGSLYDDLYNDGYFDYDDPSDQHTVAHVNP